MAELPAQDTATIAHPGMGKTQAFEYQVAGHPGVLVVEGNEMIIKPLNEREQEFYEKAQQQADFKSFIPVYYGTLQRSSGSQEDSAGFICLENLTHGFEQPCVIDLKIGHRIYDIDASPEKQARMEAKAARTTSKSMGVTITGMKLFGQPAADRDWCRDLKEEEFAQAILQFFSAAETNISSKYRDYLVWQFMVEAAEYLETIEEMEVRMYSSSLLFVYDASKEKYDRLFAADGEARLSSKRADSGSDDDEIAEDCLLDMKAIDFAHSHWTPGQGPDENYISGLKRLIEVLHSLLEQNTCMDQ